MLLYKRELHMCPTGLGAAGAVQGPVPVAPARHQAAVPVARPAERLEGAEGQQEGGGASTIKPAGELGGLHWSGNLSKPCQAAWTQSVTL